MFDLAKRIFGFVTERPDPRDEMVDMALEKALEGSDPRLRALPGYKRKLRDPVSRAVDFVLESVARFPSSLEVRPKAFASNPQVRAFFGSSDQIQEVYSQSLEVRDFLALPENRMLTEFYAALRMDLERKRIFTNVLRGEQVRSDVMRTALNFGDHFIPFANGTEKALREDLEERVFMGLTEIALESMTSSRDKKSDLQEQRALLRTKLRSLQGSSLGLESFAKPQSKTTKLSDIQAKLSEVEAKLAKVSVRTSTLEDHLSQLQAVLRNPQDHISIELRSLQITRMGFEPDPRSTQDKVDEISYMEVSYQNVTVVGALTRYARTDLLPERRIEDIRVL